MMTDIQSQTDQKDFWDKEHEKGGVLHYANSTAFAATVLATIKPQSKILELGCGVGNDSVAFANAGHEVLATDFSKVAIKKNTERFKEVANIRFEVLDISHPFSFEPNTFDVVYARLSLHYFPDTATKRIFEDIHRILKPQGFLFFMCKSTKDPLYGKGEEIENDMFDNDGHVRHFFSEEYAKQCLADKFKIIQLEEKTDILYDRTSSFIGVIAQKAYGETETLFLPPGLK